MTPDRRLNQLEPLVADVLQKVDRLIEGQSRLIDTIFRVEQKADLAAKGVADLTVITQRQYEDLRAKQQTLQSDMNILHLDQQALQTSVDTLHLDQQALQAGQEAIMQYLKEKLP